MLSGAYLMPHLAGIDGAKAKTPTPPYPTTAPLAILVTNNSPKSPSNNTTSNLPENFLKFTSQGTKKFEQKWRNA